MYFQYNPFSTLSLPPFQISLHLLGYTAVLASHILFIKVPSNHSQQGSQTNPTILSTQILLYSLCLKKRTKIPNMTQDITEYLFLFLQLSPFYLWYYSPSAFILVFVSLFFHFLHVSAQRSRVKVFTIAILFLWNFQHLSLALVTFSSS